MSDNKLLLADCISAGFCVSGVKILVKTFDRSFMEFARNGASFEDVEKALADTDDVNIRKAYEIAKERINNG